MPSPSGARPFLIAYNINLETRDVDLAKRIAQAHPRALGRPARVSRRWACSSTTSSCAQVSMNLLDFTVTPIWRVWETGRPAGREAEGVELRESELIGLCPLAALHGRSPTMSECRAGVTGRGARSPRPRPLAAMRDFEPSMALELRLAAAPGNASG